MRVFVILLLLSSFNYTFSQTRISSGYLISEGWESVPVIVSHDFGNHTGEIGFAVGKNAMLIYDHNNVFRRQMYGENFIQRMSAHLGYDYNFKLQNRKWYPSLFVNLMYSQAPLRSRIFLPWGYLENGEIFYLMIDKYSTPVHFIEGYFGLRVSFELFPRIYYTQKIGAGGFYVLGYERSIDGIDQDVGFMFQWGLSYQFHD